MRIKKREIKKMVSVPNPTLSCIMHGEDSDRNYQIQ
jgi:hypothetical protein